MGNNNKGDYGQSNRSPQQKEKQYDSQMDRDNNQAKNAKNDSANPQRSPENGRDSNVPDSASGSNKVNQTDIEIGKRLENQDAENTNTVPDQGQRISNAEDVNDKNMDLARNKAESHIPQNSSRKPENGEDLEEQNSGGKKSGSDTSSNR